MGRYHKNPDVDLQLKMNGYRPKPPVPPMPRPLYPDVPDTPAPCDFAQASLVGSMGEALAWALLVGIGCTALWKAVAALLDVL